jgi:hypothetical protein
MLGTGGVEERWGAIREDTAEVCCVVWSDEVRNARQDGVGITVGADVFAADVAVDGCEIAVKVQEA